ncbi:MAG: hypothetical protein GXY80_05280 [Syntrophorhabdus aromaticivorans]|uniref:Uncharacterized protein n=1 Tax=Syntrophorhabdus aromaticivorans TaxID=328301 RepID=A0A971M3J5_9BACT|nr:hypothetical protein [Syntrophorhabdus aromaticivorans]
MKTKKTVTMTGTEMARFLKALSRVQAAALDLSIKAWGDKPTKKQALVPLDQLLSPLACILEKYTDFVEVHR